MTIGQITRPIFNRLFAFDETSLVKLIPRSQSTYIRAAPSLYKLLYSESALRWLSCVTIVLSV